MWLTIKSSFMWGLIWVYKKLRIITAEDADRCWDRLMLHTLIEAALKEEQDRRSWRF